MISSARPCGVGETPHLNGEAGPGAQRQNNYHHKYNYFGGLEVDLVKHIIQRGM